MAHWRGVDGQPQPAISAHPPIYRISNIMSNYRWRWPDGAPARLQARQCQTAKRADARRDKARGCAPRQSAETAWRDRQGGHFGSALLFRARLPFGSPVSLCAPPCPAIFGRVQALTGITDGHAGSAKPCRAWAAHPFGADGYACSAPSCDGLSAAPPGRTTAARTSRASISGGASPPGVRGIPVATPKETPGPLPLARPRRRPGSRFRRPERPRLSQAGSG